MLWMTLGVLCPTSWHVPTDEEWTELTGFLGGQSVAGGKMKTTGTLSAGTGLWFAPNTAPPTAAAFPGFRAAYAYQRQLRYSELLWLLVDFERDFNYNGWARRLAYLSGNAGRLEST
jgi:uncharacterized protein (TIGR02145 family)